LFAEACAGLKLSIVIDDGRRYHVPSATAVQHEDSRTKEYELSLLTKHFLGKAGLYFHFTTLGISTELRGRSAVFGNAFADKFPLGDAQDGGYKLYIFLFMVVTVPLACASIKDQLDPNVVETARFVMAILMVGTISPVRTAPTSLILVRKEDQLMTLV
jgi:hypothetical protein